MESLWSLIGVIVGWLLKSGTDFLTAAHRERATRRKCTFYLLRAWKALLDYERVVSLLTSKRPDVEEYEPLRQSYAARFLSRIAEDKDSLATGVDMLASIDPTAAAQLDNTIKNIKFALRQDFGNAVKNDPHSYVETMNRHNDLIDWTLSDFQNMAEKLAKKSGFFEKHKVSKWFEARVEGKKEFNDGVASFERRVQERKAKEQALQSSPKALLQIFTDPAEWDKARWSGTVFIGHQQDGERLMLELGIGFADFQAGKGIFEGWIERVGHVDQFEEIRISIIEGPIPGKPDGYTVMISSNPDNTILRIQQTEPEFSPTKVMILSRMHRMNPLPGSTNLEKFKKAFNQCKVFRLFPCHVEAKEIKETDTALYIEKQQLHFVHTSDITPSDPEYAVFARTAPES
jgi:hypothetical protein